jgi:hypothetical protein
MAFNKKSVVPALAFALVAAGVVLLLITQPAGAPGSNPSGSIADVSEDVHPYLIEGLVLLLVGIVVLVVAQVRK